MLRERSTVFRKNLCVWLFFLVFHSVMSAVDAYIQYSKIFFKKKKPHITFLTFYFIYMASVWVTGNWTFSLTFSLPLGKREARPSALIYLLGPSLPSEETYLPAGPPAEGGGGAPRTPRPRVLPGPKAELGLPPASARWESAAPARTGWARRGLKEGGGRLGVAGQPCVRLLCCPQRRLWAGQAAVVSSLDAFLFQSVDRFGKARGERCLLVAGGSGKTCCARERFANGGGRYGAAWPSSCGPCCLAVSPCFVVPRHPDN